MKARIMMYFASNHENNVLLFYCFEDIFFKIYSERKSCNWT